MSSAFDVVARIVRSNPRIEALTLVTYVEAPNWRELLGPDEKTDAAFRMRGLNQDQGERVLTEIARSEASVENLSDIALRLTDHKLLGVCSRVRLSGGGSAHIPMMDFMCAASKQNKELLVELLRELRQGRCCLLESGRSYHYYGFQLLSEEQWKIFLGKCLLMDGFADERYVGHQLVDGYCVLRLSSGTLKAHVPTVVAELS